MNDSFSFVLKVLIITLMINFFTALIVHDSATTVEKTPCPDGPKKLKPLTSRMVSLFSQQAVIPMASTINLGLVLMASLLISTYIHISF